MKHPHTIIIAEAGVNHNGDMAVAMRMIEEAARAGVDYVKFQTFKASNLVTSSAQRAKYQADNCGGDESQLQMLQRLELAPQQYFRLKEHCRACGVGFLSSPFDMESIDVLATLGQDYWKIPSGEITNLPYLRRVASVASRVIISTGMCEPAEIADAIKVFTDAGLPLSDITILHCNTQYPTPMADVNLLAMTTLRNRFGCPTGYSDHTPGIEVPIAAVALGAEMIEKHFTLDKSMPGPDHRASLNPAELTDMVRAIRNIELALGTPEKAVTGSEMANKTVARKSIVAAAPIRKGELLTEQNLTTKRPGTGISPMMWDSVIGTAATRDYLPDELIEWTND